MHFECFYAIKNMQFLISYKYLIQILNKIHLDCLKIDIKIKSFLFKRLFIAV